jgi:hypothetical protein
VSFSAPTLPALQAAVAPVDLGGGPVLGLLVLWLGSSPTYSWLGGLGGGLVESLGELVEVLAGEFPLEGGGDLLVAAAEGE